MASLRSAAFVILPLPSRLAFGDPGRSGRCRRGGGGVESALRRLRWLGFVLALGAILNGSINRERYVGKEKLVYAKEISDVNEHIIYAAFSARAVKFAREDGFGHGKNIYPWFDNV